MSTPIPPTSVAHYLTGYTALNIPSPEGTGDWHTETVFRGAFGHRPGPFHVAGRNYPGSTPWLGAEGVFDCRERLIEFGFPVPEGPVWAADHYRAIADHVLSYVRDGADLMLGIQLDDWFPEPQEKQRVFARLHALRDQGAFTTAQWDEISTWMRKQPDQ